MKNNWDLEDTSDEEDFLEVDIKTTHNEDIKVCMLGDTECEGCQ